MQRNPLLSRVQHSTDRGPRIAGYRLHENSFEAGAIFQRGNQQRIQSKPSGKTEIPSLPRQLDHCVLYGVLQTGSYVGRLRFLTEALEKLGRKASVAGMFRGKETPVQPQTGVGHVQDLRKKLLVPVIAIDGKPL